MKNIYRYRALMIDHINEMLEDGVDGTELEQELLSIRLILEAHWQIPPGLELLNPSLYSTMLLLYDRTLAYYAQYNT